MIPKELADQVQSEVKRLKEVQDQFIQTYIQLCIHYGGRKWQKDHTEVISHQIRGEIIPIMEQAGMDHMAAQAFCSWAEKLVVHK
jgi:hypothetical protein